MDINKIHDKLEKIISNDTIKLNEPMKNHTSFRVGGPADVLILPRSVKDISNVVKFCKSEDIPLLVIGNGTNLLVRDKGIRGIVIKLSKNFNDISLDKNTIKCTVGVSLSLASRFALNNSLSGLEFAYGIPGSVGGATVMNAGAYGGNMADVVKKVKLLDTTGNTFEMESDELCFSYRSSILQDKKDILLGVEMELIPGDFNKIKGKMVDYITRRKAKQPLNIPNAGSTFKRPKNSFAGYLIEKAGLKGYRIGGASVSEVHAGFIVNDNNATCEDIVKLIKHIQQEVVDKFNIMLEPEIKIVGENEKEE